MISPAKLFKCLADETRLRCVVLLHRQGKLCVCELTYALEVLQPKISRHLALLRQSGLLVDSREGQWVYYQLNSELPVWVQRILDETVQTCITTDTKHQNDTKRLLAMESRPDFKNCCQ